MMEKQLNHLTTEYEQYLFSELRLVSYLPGDTEQLDDDRLALAVTLSENLLSLGYGMRPEDLCRLAVSESLQDFYQKMIRLVGEVPAKPMYPDFPKQVMCLDEATYRMHQIMHYFSTYGSAFLTGCKLSRGWLPDMQETEKTRSDTVYLPQKIIELLPVEEVWQEPVRRILARKARVRSLAEQKILQTALIHCPPAYLAALEIPFKENLIAVFELILQQESLTAEERRALLRALCKHTGDVLKCLLAYLKKRKYHLRTSEKRLLVKLLEAYPAADFRENLMPSNRKSADYLNALRFLDYNTYSRSAEHKQAVDDLRNKRLSSWEGRIRKKLESVAREYALDLADAATGSAIRQARQEVLLQAAKRPGMMLRMLAWLLRLGYTKEELVSALRPQVEHLSIQTLVTLLSHYEAILTNPGLEEADQTSWKHRYYQSQLEHIRGQMQALRGKESARCHAVYEKRLNDRGKRQKWLRAQEHFISNHTRLTYGGRIYLPEYRDDLKKALRQLHEDPYWRTQPIMIPESDQDAVWDTYFQEIIPSSLMKALSAEQHAERNAYQEFQKQMYQICHERYQALEAHYQHALTPLYELMTRTRNKQKEEKDKQQLAEQKRAASFWHATEQKRLYQDVFLQLVEELIEERLKYVTTPFRGQKVYLDSRGADLSHMTITVSKEETGGYRGNGVVYFIPDQVSVIRFFVYWNDPDWVDLDLHAYAITEDGEQFKVGYDADYQNHGIVHSGDITDCDAAEYIDVSINSNVKKVVLVLDIFNGKEDFTEIETCFAGIMEINDIDEEVQLYSPKNCLFSQNILSSHPTVLYGSIDLETRSLVYEGQGCNLREDHDSFFYEKLKGEVKNLSFHAEKYLDLLLKAQEAVRVEDASQADAILVFEKASAPREISLIDANMFMDM